MNTIAEIEYVTDDACQCGHDVPISIARVIDGTVVHADRIEHSLQMLEALQSTFSRGRAALEPYFDSAKAAYERLGESPDEEERQRILETVEALEKVMRMSEKSRGCLESQTGFSAS